MVLSEQHALRSPLCSDKGYKQIANKKDQAINSYSYLVD